MLSPVRYTQRKFRAGGTQGSVFSLVAATLGSGKRWLTGRHHSVSVCGLCERADLRAAADNPGGADLVLLGDADSGGGGENED